MDIKEFSPSVFISSYLVANGCADVDHNQLLNYDRVSILASLYEIKNPNTCIALAGDDIVFAQDTSANIITKTEEGIVCHGSNKTFYDSYADKELVEWLKQFTDYSTTALYNTLKSNL